MKKFILCIISFIGLSLFGKSSVCCANECTDQAGCWYVSGFGGINFLCNEQGLSTSYLFDYIPLDMKLGPVLGGAVGYKFSQDGLFNPRVELEVSYRENKYKDWSWTMTAKSGWIFHKALNLSKI